MIFKNLISYFKKTIRAMMHIKYLLLFVLVLCSCQQAEGIKQWFNNWKEHGLTQLASEATSNSLTEGEKGNLLIIFLDIEKVSTNCNALKEQIENHRFLRKIEEDNDFKRGFLFDSLYEYNYEKALFNSRNRKSTLEKWAFIAVGVWKTEFTMSRINQLIKDITDCYPYSSS